MSVRSRQKTLIRVPRGTEHVAVRAVNDPIDFVFVLVPSYSMIAFVTAIEVLRISNQLSGRGLYRWTVLSDDGAPVVSSNGLSVSVDGALQQQALKARVYVCSGVEPSKNTSNVVWSWIARQWAHGAHIGSLCTGTYPTSYSGNTSGPGRCGLANGTAYFRP